MDNKKRNKKSILEQFLKLDNRSKFSYFFIGLGQILQKQYLKGLIFTILNFSFIIYFIFRGIRDLRGLITLGIKRLISG